VNTPIKVKTIDTHEAQKDQSMEKQKEMIAATVSAVNVCEY